MHVRYYSTGATERGGAATEAGKVPHPAVSGSAGEVGREPPPTKPTHRIPLDLLDKLLSQCTVLYALTVPFSLRQVKRNKLSESSSHC